MKNIKVLLAIPVYQHCETETMKSVYDLKVPLGITIQLYFQKGYTVNQARNEIVKHSLNKGFDYTFFVDSDMLLPDFALQKLLELNVPIASGWYIKKVPGTCIPQLFDRDNTGNIIPINKLPKDKCIEVHGIGFGCVLINNKVFKNMNTNCWFTYMYYPNGDKVSEDINFCIEAESKGYKIIVDTSIVCGHIGQAMFVPSIDIFEEEQHKNIRKPEKEII